jgi:LemA protein
VLAGSENRIAVERMRYNETVRAYNTRLRRFPTKLFASATGFHTRQYFEAPPSVREVPRVDFGTKRG